MLNICQWCAEDMPKISQKYPQDILKICPNYAQYMPYMPKIWQRYVKDLHKISPKYKISLDRWMGGMGKCLTKLSWRNVFLTKRLSQSPWTKCRTKYPDETPSWQNVHSKSKRQVPNHTKKNIPSLIGAGNLTLKFLFLGWLTGSPLPTATKTSFSFSEQSCG